MSHLNFNAPATCPQCRKVYPPDLLPQDEPDAEEAFNEWKAGELIQRVWPGATSIQREQLQTGICSDKCWDEFLGPER